MPIDSHLDYLQKHAVSPPQIVEPPHPDLRVVVVVRYLEDAVLREFIGEIAAIAPPKGAMEVIAVSDQGDLASIRQFLEGKNAANDSLPVTSPAHVAARRCFALDLANLPTQHIGEGMMLKVGMDEAVSRFRLAGRDDGLIVVLEAGNICPTDFLVVVQDEFARHPKVQTMGVETRYEPSSLHPEMADALIRIRLSEHLLVAGLRFCGHPYAFPMMEIGFAVHASAYQAQMGMNRRKQGATFDFLQKFVELGAHRHCTATAVAARSVATNIPRFEIGFAIWEYWKSPNPDYPVFASESFFALKTGLEQLRSWFGMAEAELQAALAQFSEGFRQFMQTQGFVAKVLEMKRYTKTAEAFEKRFHRWFNSLKTLQYFQYCRDHHWPDRPIVDVGNELAAWMAGGSVGEMTLEELVMHFGRA
ncbi:MAG TPA: hypothetical protein VHS96_03035 [Bacteroidia bacterium]|nr:hypothetical protein [Bacteroidia bacterium]